MRTLYIDVFFLINATVDILALYFAAILSKTVTSPRRLIIAALIGALAASLIVLLPESFILKLFISALSLFLIVCIATRKCSMGRKIKFGFCFIIFEALVGGVISFIWNIFDRYLHGYFTAVGGGEVNRKMLFFSLIILLSIGVFRMLVSFFSNIECEGRVELEISFLGKEVKFEAFVDSGNLAIDPMDMRPVLLMKKQLARKLLPENVVELKDPDLLEREVRKRIRLIPISTGGATHVLTGIKVDRALVLKDGKKEEISITVAIDKEGGNYGGYYALIPSAAICDVTKK